MDSLLSTVLAALIAALTSLVVARHAAKAELEKLRREYLLEHQSEHLVRQLLQREEWSKRSFKAIRRHIGGFEDQQLRQILIRAGAVRLADNTDPSRELWGLIERHTQEIGSAADD